MEVVGESAFENNQKVQFVVVPKSVKRLDAYVFWGCNNLEEVVLVKVLPQWMNMLFQDAPD